MLLGLLGEPQGVRAGARVGSHEHGGRSYSTTTARGCERLFPAAVCAAGTRAGNRQGVGSAAGPASGRGGEPPPPAPPRESVIPPKQRTNQRNTHPTIHPSNHPRVQPLRQSTRSNSSHQKWHQHQQERYRTCQQMATHTMLLPAGGTQAALRLLFYSSSIHRLHRPSPANTDGRK